MNFNLQFSLYKSELITKLNSNSIEEIEMSMLKKDVNDDNNKIVMDISNNTNDQKIVKLIVKKYYDM